MQANYFPFIIAATGYSDTLYHYVRHSKNAALSEQTKRSGGINIKSVCYAFLQFNFLLTHQPMCALSSNKNSS